MGSKVLSWKKVWVGHYYPTTHSSYARGFSILIHKSLPFELLDRHLDPEGKYFMLHAMVEHVEIVVMGYINPHFPPPVFLCSIKLSNNYPYTLQTIFSWLETLICHHAHTRINLYLMQPRSQHF